MSRYAQVDRSMWVDEKFLGLSAPKPNAQSLFLWLLTSPDACIIPGTFRIGVAGISEALGWSAKTTAEKLSELESAGMIRADLKARFIWLPNALRRNEPKAPDNLKPWGKAWHELPECALKTEVWEAARDYFDARGAGFIQAFETLCPHPLVRDSRHPKGGAKGGAMGTDTPKEVATHSPAPINMILNPDPELEQEQPKPHPAARLGSERLADALDPKPVPQSGPLSAKETELLAALSKWPSLALIADPDHAREFWTNGSAAGWTIGDMKTGIDALAVKHSGPTTPAALYSKLAGFVKNEHIARRSGLTPGLTALPGGKGSGAISNARPDPAPRFGSALTEEEIWGENGRPRK